MGGETTVALSSVLTSNLVEKEERKKGERQVFLIAFVFAGGGQDKEYRLDQC